jgi:HEPN domain-containing protein
VSRRDEAEYLLERSKQFLETAKYQIGKGFFSLAVFSLEQALQLSLKSKMLASGVDYPRSHSVRTLLEMLLDLVPEVEKVTIRQILDSYLLELGMLEDAYITSRYVRREFRREEAEVLMRVVKEVMKNVT